MNADQITELARKSINILFISNPRGTSIGILIGVVLDGLNGFISPALNTAWTSASSIELWHFIGLGIVSMNLPSYLRRKEIDSSIINAISFIEEQKAKGNIADWQVKQMYSNLHQKVLESVSLENDKQEKANKINLLLTEVEISEKSNK